jgi:hypothetical protein
MKSTRVHFLLGLIFSGALLLGSGCTSAPQANRYSIKFELAPSLVGSSIQVDLIGANAVSDLPKWQTTSVTEYWQPDNSQRRDAEKAVLQFGPGKDNVQIFSGNDAIWNRWISTGAMYLVVLVDLPGIAKDREGNADPRRLTLPLDGKKWPSDLTTVDLRVQESGIRLLTPIKGP